MKPFAALDEVLNSRALTPAAPREIAQSIGDFQPLFSENGLRASSKPGPEPHSHGAPQIELVEADGRIRQIVVICGCGERSILDCAY